MVLLSLVILTCIHIGYCSTFSCNTTDACRYDMMICAQGSTCDIHCSGENACAWSRIFCPSDSICNIFCSGEDGCGLADVYCSTSECNIQCTGNGGCERTDIHAQDSSKLQIDCTVADESAPSCVDLEIYCPADGMS